MYLVGFSTPDKAAGSVSLEPSSVVFEAVGINVTVSTGWLVGKALDEGARELVGPLVGDSESVGGGLVVGAADTVGELVGMSDIVGFGLIVGAGDTVGLAVGAGDMVGLGDTVGELVLPKS